MANINALGYSSGKLKKVGDADTLVIDGNLQVQGTSVTINSTSVQIDDKTLTLGRSDVAAQTATLGSGTGVVTVADTAGYAVGALLTKTSSGGGSFGSNATISSIDSDTQFTASLNHSATGTITFTVDNTTDAVKNGAGIIVEGDTQHSLSYDNTNDSFTSSEHVNVASGKGYKINGNLLAAADLSDVSDAGSGAIITGAERSKLGGIEALATADQTAAEIKALVESASDSNTFTDADHSKLDAIEANADVTDTANVTSAGALMDSELASIADVKALNQSVISGAAPAFGTANFTDASDKRLMTDAQETKLDSVESSADVTDTANVTAAGALMDSELADLAGVKGVTISTLQVKPSEGAFANGDKTKLDAIEAAADVTDTANVTAAGALMDSEVTNLAQVKAFDSSDYATAAQGATANAALPKAGGEMSGNITMSGSETVDGRDLSVDGAKLDGIESGATADQTNAEIRAAVEAASDSNVFTDDDHNKLNGIEASATADQTDAEIRAAVEAASDSNVFTDADHSKLNAIEASADVTDATNVEAAGALMDTEVDNLAQVKAFDETDYATAAQGTTADAALPRAGGTMSGAIAMGTSKITGMGDPTANQDAATKAYVDGQINQTSEQASFTVTGGAFINKFFDASEAISGGQIVAPAGNNTLQKADHSDAAKDALVGIAVDDAGAASGAVLTMRVPNSGSGFRGNVGNNSTMVFDADIDGTGGASTFTITFKTGTGSSSTSFSSGAANVFMATDTNVQILSSIRAVFAGSIAGGGELNGLSVSAVGTNPSDANQDQFTLTSNGVTTGHNFTNATAELGSPAELFVVNQNASSAVKVQMALPGSSVAGFDFSAGLTVGQELYLTTNGGMSGSAPTSGAVVRAGYVMSSGVQDGGNPHDTFLFLPQFIMDN